MIVHLAVFIFGLIFGSFLNVCIYRLPSHQSVVTLRSRCPHCDQSIAPWDNIPVVNYWWLGGRCRNCRKPISLLYPTVEVLTGLLFWLAFHRFGISPAFIKFSLLGMLLLILIFTDLQKRMIPHSVTVFGILMGTTLSWVVWVDHAPSTWFLNRMGFFPPTPEAESFLGSVAGALLGGGSFYLVGTLFYYLKGREKEYLGFGDVMLMTMVGSFLGVSLTLLTMFLGSLLATLVGVPLQLATQRFRRYEWPFGSCLGLVALFSSFAGDAVIDEYLRMTGMN